MRRPRRGVQHIVGDVGGDERHEAGVDGGAAKRITKALEIDESTHSLPEQGEVPMRLLIDRVRRSALQAERR